MAGGTSPLQNVVVLFALVSTASVVAVQLLTGSWFAIPLLAGGIGAIGFIITVQNLQAILARKRANARLYWTVTGAVVSLMAGVGLVALGIDGNLVVVKYHGIAVAWSGLVVYGIFRSPWNYGR